MPRGKMEYVLRKKNYPKILISRGLRGEKLRNINYPVRKEVNRVERFTNVLVHSNVKMYGNEQIVIKRSPCVFSPSYH